MEDGKIIEVGGHEGLLGKSNGLYRKLWALQNDQVRA